MDKYPCLSDKSIYGHLDNFLFFSAPIQILYLSGIWPYALYLLED